ncbi:helix-turn-helix transcriptional regulator [Candidatus Kaiserbacteria bacterium]|nr:helix-turn-helix transcriptional regulator [Candidatus Kaiserbacteria bacterium]
MKTETINNIVAIKRKERGVTQEELAFMVGVTRQTIISIEKGNYIPSVLLAMKLAVFFGVAVEEIFNIKLK